MDAQDQERLDQVHAALQRIDEGTYGICTRCGGEINPERLNALPYAEHCVRCQRRDEAPMV